MIEERRARGEQLPASSRPSTCSCPSPTPWPWCTRRVSRTATSSPATSCSRRAGASCSWTSGSCCPTPTAPAIAASPARSSTWHPRRSPATSPRAARTSSTSTRWACVGFELLAGVEPFDGEEALELYRAKTRTPLPRVSALRADVPAPLDDLLAQLMAPDAARAAARRRGGALAASRAAHAHRAPTARRARSRCSIVDDDPDICNGADASTCAPRRRMQRSRRPPRGGRRSASVRRRVPDLLLLDLDLPDINGIEVCMLLRGMQLGDACMIVSVSGRATKADVELLQLLGVQSLEKGPALMKELVQLVQGMRRCAKAGPSGCTGCARVHACAPAAGADSLPGDFRAVQGLRWSGPMARFLVVDDDKAVVKGLTILLRDDGHEVAPFTTGADPSRPCRASPSTPCCGLEMPHVDGHAVVDAARRHNPDACLVVVTARPEQHEKRLTDAGACLVADKPLDTWRSRAPSSSAARTAATWPAVGARSARGRTSRPTCTRDANRAWSVSRRRGVSASDPAVELSGGLARPVQSLRLCSFRAGEETPPKQVEEPMEAASPPPASDRHRGRPGGVAGRHPAHVSLPVRRAARPAAVGGGGRHRPGPARARARALHGVAELRRRPAGHPVAPRPRGLRPPPLPADASGLRAAARAWRHRGPGRCGARAGPPRPAPVAARHAAALARRDDAGAREPARPAGTRHVQRGGLGGVPGCSAGPSRRCPASCTRWLRDALAWTALRPVLGYAALCLAHALLLGRCAATLPSQVVKWSRGTPMRTRLLSSLASFARLFAALTLATRALLPRRPPGCPDVDPLGEAPTFGDETAAAEAIPGEIAVDLRDDATDADIADLDARYGLRDAPEQRVEHHARPARGRRRRPVARSRRSLDALSHDPRVEHAEPMALYRATFVPDDPLYGSKQWHLQARRRRERVGLLVRPGLTVAVIDTGVACFDKGPFTKGPISPGRAARAGGTSSTTAPPRPTTTATARTSPAPSRRPRTTAWAPRAWRSAPRSCPSRCSASRASAPWPTWPRASASRPTTARRSSTCPSAGPIKSKILEDAVDHALSKGVVVVAAAGNSGRSVGYPAAYPGVIAVSATDDNDKIAWFSSRGPEVAIAAPGVDVTQQTICNGGKNKCEIFGTFNGTSMASPHVAGVAAMVESLGVTDAGRGARRADVDGRAPRTRRTSTARASSTPGRRRRASSGRTCFRGAALLGLAWLVAPAHPQARRASRRARAGAVVGALVARVGPPAVRAAPRPAAYAGKLRTVLELAMRPLGEWDLVLVRRRDAPLAAAGERAAGARPDDARLRQQPRPPVHRWLRPRHGGAARADRLVGRRRLRRRALRPRLDGRQRPRLPLARPDGARRQAHRHLARASARSLELTARAVVRPRGRAPKSPRGPCRRRTPSLRSGSHARTRRDTGATHAR